MRRVVAPLTPQRRRAFYDARYIVHVSMMFSRHVAARVDADAMPQPMRLIAPPYAVAEDITLMPPLPP